MEKIGLLIAASILLIACGSNAESSVSEKNEIINNEEVFAEKIIEEQTFTDVLVPKEEVAPDIEEELLVEKEEQKSEPVLQVIKEVQKEINKESVSSVQKIVLEPAIVDEKVLMLNHEDWNSLLQKYVTPSGVVNYKGFKTELVKLSTYLKVLKENSPKVEWSKNEKLAYWINLYNASTVYLIATNYPTASITKLGGGKPWDKKFVKVGSKVYTLNQIENEIIRPRFKDPRIHAALNCAAVSCPSLRNEAYLASKLNIQLNDQCYAWINDRDRNEVGPHKLVLSKIFEWYGDDFIAGGGVVKFVGKYNRTKILINPKAKISYKEYNWDLND